MKQTVVQLLVGLLGLFMLVWGEAKHYIQSHPEIINTFQLEAKRAEPLQYYNYQVAYDPNTNKLWYYYGDGFWYDRPPTIPKRPIQAEKQPTTGVGGSPVPRQVGGQTAQTSAYTTRY